MSSPALRVKRAARNSAVSKSAMARICPPSKPSLPETSGRAESPSMAILRSFRPAAARTCVRPARLQLVRHNCPYVNNAGNRVMARRPGGEAEICARIAAAPGLDAREAHRLAGLCDAESCFAIVPNNGNGWRCVYQVALRDDDRDTLATYRQRLTALGRA